MPLTSYARWQRFLPILDPSLGMSTDRSVVLSFALLTVY